VVNKGTVSSSPIISSSGFSLNPPFGGAPWQAMDGNLTSDWDSKKGRSCIRNQEAYSLTIDFGAPTVVEEVRLKGAGDGVHDAKDINLYVVRIEPKVPVTVEVHYEMYDGIPALKKWISVRHNGGASSETVVVDTLAMDLLRARCSVSPSLLAPPPPAAAPPPATKAQRRRFLAALSHGGAFVFLGQDFAATRCCSAARWCVG
jgi:hypothetical protein